MRALIVPLLLPFAAAAALTFAPIEGTARPWQGGTFPDTAFEGVRYVSWNFLESLFRQEGSWIPDRQKLVIADAAPGTGGGRKWTFTLDNPYMNIGDEVFNLGFPVRRGPELLYLPLSPLIRILNGNAGYALPMPGPAASAAEPRGAEPARPLPPGANILDLGTEERENGTLVSVRTAGRLGWESFWVPPHFILKFQKGLLAPRFPSKTSGQGLVKNILALQEKDLAQITLTIHKPIDTVEVAYTEESQGYIVTVRKPGKGSKAEKPADGWVAAQEGAKGAGTIIIDPGHGGKDQGAQVGGVNEAQVTLAVGLALKEALEKLGYKALLTREKDEYVTLEERPKFASSKGGDLFVSLHCNSINGSPKRKKTVNGFVAYILREGESEEDKALARRENQAVTEGGHANKAEISPVEWILLEHQLNIYSKESEAFTEHIVKEFGDFPIGKYGTGASQAGFYVLVGAYMPAVLFEMGFLTNDRDRKFMASEKGQKQLAERLARAIHKFRTVQKAK